MNLIFISSMASSEKYRSLCKKRRYPMQDSSQKFFDMFLKGFADTEITQIDCISVLPVSRSTYPEKRLKSETEVQGHITYHYAGMYNSPILKVYTARRSVKKVLKTLLHNAEKDQTVVVCDPLLLEGASAAISYGKRYGVRTIGFLTDMPEYSDECDKHSFLKKWMYRYYNRKCSALLQRFDGYVFLTEQMSHSLNHQKPWMLLECIVEGGSPDLRDPAKKEDIPTILYAGKLHKQFGMDVFLTAIGIVKHPCRWEIYGDGNYRGELERYALSHDSVQLHGIVPVDEVMQAEAKSTVLLNPRTSEGTFTKYSFPSKTAEYMLSGVPVIMFKLPGIPDAYDDYLFYPEEETAKALAATIEEVLSLPAAELFQRGSKAREFILQEKSNCKQAARFVNFIKETEAGRK